MPAPTNAHFMSQMSGSKRKFFSREEEDSGNQNKFDSDDYDESNNQLILLTTAIRGQVEDVPSEMLSMSSDQERLLFPFHSPLFLLLRQTHWAMSPLILNYGYNFPIQLIQLEYTDRHATTQKNRTVRAIGSTRAYTESLSVPRLSMAKYREVEKLIRSTAKT